MENAKEVEKNKQLEHEELNMRFRKLEKEVANLSSQIHRVIEHLEQQNPGIYKNLKNGPGTLLAEEPPEQL